MITVFVNNITAADELVLCEQILKLLVGSECRVSSSRAGKEFKLNKLEEKARRNLK